MASEAEVDLVISTANALPELERELGAIITAAEASADPVELQAALDSRDALVTLIAAVTETVNAVESQIPEIEVQAALDTIEALEQIQSDLDTAIDIAEANAAAVQVDAELDADVAELDAEIAALVNELEASAPEVDIHVDVDRDDQGGASLLRLGRGLKGLAGPLGGAVKGFAGLNVAASSLLPLLAGVGAAVAQIAPASALAVSGLLTVQLASGAVKLAMVGVGEAVKTAFDPEAKPEELAEAMEKLSPAARSFVTELRGMGKEFKEIQQSVQQNVFQGLDKALERLGKTVLPTVKEALQRTAGELNAMALGAAEAAAKLGEDGTLGQALDGSVRGLENLNKLPGQLVTGLGQIAAAAAPAFTRITAAAGGAATGIADKLSAAFKSGALEDAINGAVDAIGQLGRIAGNVFGGLGNILSNVASNGEGLFSTLEKVTQAFEDVTASKGFQDALGALVETGGVIVDTVLPLLSQALQALGPIFQALGGPVQILVEALGRGLSKIIPALAPVLVSLANAFGELVGALSPVIDLAAELIAAILPALTPLFDALGQALRAVAPFIAQVAGTLAAVLVPILTTLARDVLPVILPPLIALATNVFPIMTDILARLSPSLIKLGEAFSAVLVALAPVIAQIAEVIVQMQDELMPLLQPLIDLMIRFTTEALGGIASFLINIVVPALKILVDFLKGDYRATWEGAKDLMRAIKDKILEIATALAQQLADKMFEMANRAVERIRRMGEDIVQGFRDWVNETVEEVKTLPQRAATALGNTAMSLVKAGQDLVLGFIRGIQSQLSHLRDVAASIGNSITGSVKDFLGIQSPSKVMIEVGTDTMDGLLIGLKSRMPDLRADLQGIASVIPTFALPNGQTLALPQATSAEPVVQVYLGNELLNGHFDTRIAQSNQARDRLAITGVRR